MDYEHFSEMKLLWAHFLDSYFSTIMSSLNWELTIFGEMSPRSITSDMAICIEMCGHMCIFGGGG